MVPLPSDTYIIKLFDRSVDLAQFSTSSPLYPICRAWMRNNPAAPEQPASPGPQEPLGGEEVCPGAGVHGEKRAWLVIERGETQAMDVHGL